MWCFGWNSKIKFRKIWIITNKILIHLSRDLTTIKIDLKLPTLKPLYSNTLIQIFNYFKTSDYIKIDRQTDRHTDG